MSSYFESWNSMNKNAQLESLEALNLLCEIENTQHNRESKAETVLSTQLL